MDWEHLGTRKGDFMKNHLLYESMVANFKQVFGRDHSDYLTIREKNNFTHYIDRKSAEGISLFLLDQLNKDKIFMKTMLAIGKKKYDELLDFCKNLDNVKGLNNKELADLTKEYFRLYKEPYPYFMITVFAGALEREQSEHAKETIDTMMKLRYIGRDSFNKAHELSHPLFVEIGKRFNLYIDEIKFLKPTEISDALSKNAAINFKEVIKKRQHCYFLHKKGKFELKEGGKYPIKNERIDKNTMELKGNGTFPVVYRGIVRLINTKEDLDKLKGGEIIVTRMTTPNIVTDAIKKAGAIITDEGGVTCHAAIVSREFKIPALIGTKFATKLLKDGDVVELDTEKGVVKKINIK